MAHKAQRSVENEPAPESQRCLSKGFWFHRHLLWLYLVTIRAWGSSVARVISPRSLDVVPFENHRMQEGCRDDGQKSWFVNHNIPRHHLGILFLCGEQRQGQAGCLCPQSSQVVFHTRHWATPQAARFDAKSFIWGRMKGRPKQWVSL